MAEEVTDSSMRAPVLPSTEGLKDHDERRFIRRVSIESQTESCQKSLPSKRFGRMTYHRLLNPTKSTPSHNFRSRKKRCNWWFHDSVADDIPARYRSPQLDHSSILGGSRSRRNQSDTTRDRRFASIQSMSRAAAGHSKGLKERLRPRKAPKGPQEARSSRTVSENWHRFGPLR